MRRRPPEAKGYRGHQELEGGLQQTLLRRPLKELRCRNLDLEFGASRTVRHQFLRFKPPSLWYLLRPPEQTNPLSFVASSKPDAFLMSPHQATEGYSACGFPRPMSEVAVFRLNLRHKCVVLFHPVYLIPFQV